MRRFLLLGAGAGTSVKSVTSKELSYVAAQIALSRSRGVQPMDSAFCDMICVCGGRFGKKLRMSD